ncbi:sporulation protein YjcZ [Paenibacillus sp. YSY-4.3]
MGQIGACGPGPVVPGGFWTSTGVILVLYILLVIILRAPLF